MRIRPIPRGATWLCRYFCSSPEQESVIGDLMEQFQSGRSRIWFWRQLLAIAALGIYDRIARRPLPSYKRTIPVEPAVPDACVTPLQESPRWRSNNEERRIAMRPHRGINTSSIAGEGFEGLPGLIMAIAFVFLFFGIFLPRNSEWPLAVFIVVEVVAAALYIRAQRRDREDSERSWKALHEINEERDRGQT